MTELTIPQIEEIAARAEKATPGPLYSAGNCIRDENCRDVAEVACEWRWKDNAEEPWTEEEERLCRRERTRESIFADAEFFAEARLDVPALCSTALSAIRERDALRLAIETAPCDRGCWGGTIAAGGTDEKPNRHAHLPKCWKSQIGAHG